MPVPSDARNREDVQSPCSKPSGQTGDENGKAKDIHELLGIPELVLESDSEAVEGGEPEVPQKQSKEDQNRAENEKGTNESTNHVPELDNLLQLEQEDVEEEIEYWKQAVVCFILGANPPWEVIEGFIRRIWTKFNIDKISFLPHGVFMVRFKTMEMKEKVLNSSHYLFDSKPLIFKEWTKDIEMKKTEILTVPTWVQFHQLPLKIWGKSLPKIARLVGKFIKSDLATEQKTKLGYARVMVEVEVDKQFPDQAVFKDELGQVMTIGIEYEWKPITCSKCLKMGHDSEICRKGQTLQPKTKPPQKIWRPVVKPVTTVPQLERLEESPSRSEGPKYPTKDN
ncbi:hypothetical protein vseg_015194 [Gypsophila vaccaria]